MILRRNRLEDLVESNFVVQVLNQLSQRQNRVRLQLFGADVVGDLGAGIGAENAVLIHVPVEDVPGLLAGGDELLHILCGNGMVQRVCGGHRADQDQHDQAHALLPVIGAVEEADAGAGEHHQRANRPRRRLVVLGRFVERGVLDRLLGDVEQQPGTGEAQQWRDQQPLKNPDRLLPIHAGGSTVDVHQLVGDAHADDGADHGVRAGGRQPEPPGAQVPDNGRDQQGKDHREAGAGADLKNQFDRQQRNHGEGHRAGGEEHTEPGCRRPTRPRRCWAPANGYR